MSWPVPQTVKFQEGCSNDIAVQETKGFDVQPVRHRVPSIAVDRDHPHDSGTLVASLTSFNKTRKTIRSIGFGITIISKK